MTPRFGPILGHKGVFGVSTVPEPKTSSRPRGLLWTRFDEGSNKTVSNLYLTTWIRQRSKLFLSDQKKELNRIIRGVLGPVSCDGVPHLKLSRTVQIGSTLTHTPSWKHDTETTGLWRLESSYPPTSWMTLTLTGFYFPLTHVATRTYAVKTAVGKVLRHKCPRQSGVARPPIHSSSGPRLTRSFLGGLVVRGVCPRVARRRGRT